MEILILFNMAAVGVAYLILGLPAKRTTRRLDAATLRLADTTVDKTVQARFVAVRKASSKKASGVFWLSLLLVLVGLGIASSLYATSIEPSAEIATWVMVSFVIFGIALVGIAILLSRLLSVYWQSHNLTALMNEYVTTYPNSPVLREAREMVVPKLGELGVSMVAFSPC